MKKKGPVKKTAAPDIFDRMRNGETVSTTDKSFAKVQKLVERTLKLSVALNASTNITQMRERLGKILGTKLDKSVTLFTPFYTNFGRFTSLGKNVFINRDCIFLDLGGIEVG